MGSRASARFVDVSCELLAQGYGVRFRATGGSMRPAVCDGDLVTIAPATRVSLVAGNVLVYRAAGRLFAHRVVTVEGSPAMCRQLVLRGDALPMCDAPVNPAQVVGELIGVRRADPRTRRARIAAFAARVLAGVRRIGASAIAN